MARDLEEYQLQEQKANERYSTLKIKTDELTNVTEKMKVLEANRNQRLEMDKAKMVEELEATKL